MTKTLTTLYRDTRKGHKTLYPDGKKCAIPSLHRDSFSAKVPGFNPDAVSGNTTSPYCRAVMGNSTDQVTVNPDNFIISSTTYTSQVTKMFINTLNYHIKTTQHY